MEGSWPRIITGKIIMCNLMMIIVIIMNFIETLNTWSTYCQHKTVHTSEWKNKHVTVVKDISCSVLIWWHYICYIESVLYVFLCLCVCDIVLQLPMVKTAYEWI